MRSQQPSTPPTLLDPVAFFKCLADETRLCCLLLVLQEGELCVCELTVALAQSQPKISRHLARLRDCGLLLDRRQGQWVFYQLHPALPAWAHQALAETAAGNRGLLSQANRRLARMGARPQRVSACCR